MELTSSHRYVQNTSICQTVCIEHLLNTGKRPQTSERARKPPHNRLGWKKRERERERSGDRTCAPERELWLWRRKGPLTGQVQSFRASEESAATSFWKAKQSVTHPPWQQTLMCWPRQGLGAKAWASEVIPRERSGVGYTQLVEAGILQLRLHTEEAWALRGEDPLWRAMQGEGKARPAELLSLLTLLGSRMPPTNSGGMHEPAPPLWASEVGMDHWESCKQPPVTAPAIQGACVGSRQGPITAPAVLGSQAAAGRPTSRCWLLPWCTWSERGLPNLCYCCSVTKSCLILCNPMDCNTPAFPVLHYLPEFAQIHVHWVIDAVKPPRSLSSPSPFAFSLSLCQDFSHDWLFASGGQSTGTPHMKDIRANTRWGRRQKHPN